MARTARLDSTCETSPDGKTVTQRKAESKFFRGAVFRTGNNTSSPETEQTVQGIDWEQDFEAAKKTAASECKNVLILFDALDSNESSVASNRFRDAVATRKEFRERAVKEYVCVYNENRELAEKFHIAVFPAVLVTDPKGRPFGVLEGRKINEKATLLNPDELHLVYAHWPTFNRKGIRQIEDTKADDSIKRISSM